MSRINDIREREKAATPGEWSWLDAKKWGGGLRASILGNWERRDVIIDTETDLEGTQLKMSSGDAYFISHSRADIPYLLARLDEAVGMLKAYAIEVSPCRSCGEIIFLATDHDPHCALNAIIKGVEG